MDHKYSPIPNIDIINFYTKQTMQIIGKSRDIECKINIEKLAIQDLKLQYEFTSKLPYIKTTIKSYGDKNFQIEPRLEFNYKDINFSVARSSIITFNKEFSNDKLNSNIQTKGHFLINPFVNLGECFLLNTFKYGIASFTSLIHGKIEKIASNEDINQKVILGNIECNLNANIVVENFAGTLFYKTHKQRFGVAATSGAGRFPLAFSFSHGPSGIKWTVGGKAHGEMNQLRAYVQNMSTFCACTDLYPSPKVKLSLWMKTPILNTEKATYGARLRINYSK